MPETKRYFFLILVVGTVIGGAILAALAGRPGSVEGIYISAVAADTNDEFLAAPPPAAQEPDSRFRLVGGLLPAPELSARAVLVKEPRDPQPLYRKNPHLVLPIASLTKLMTAIVVYKHASLDDVVKIDAADLGTESYLAGLVAGEKIRIRDLLQAMLVSSANDATLALARAVGGTTEQFVAEMNEEAKALGMNETRFSNPIGFDAAGHYSTVSDLSRLVDEFLQYPELSAFVREKSAVLTSVDGRIRHRISTTNKLLLKYSDVIGLKTGYTAEAKGNLIILVAADDTSQAPALYYSIILGSDNREQESEKIMSWVKDNFEWN